MSKRAEKKRRERWQKITKRNIAKERAIKKEIEDLTGSIYAQISCIPRINYLP